MKTCRRRAAASRKKANIMKRRKTRGGKRLLTRTLQFRRYRSKKIIKGGYNLHLLTAIQVKNGKVVLKRDFPCSDKIEGFVCYTNNSFPSKILTELELIYNSRLVDNDEKLTVAQVNITDREINGEKYKRVTVTLEDVQKKFMNDLKNKLDEINPDLVYADKAHNLYEDLNTGSPSSAAPRPSVAPRPSAAVELPSVKKTIIITPDQYMLYNHNNKIYNFLTLLDSNIKAYILKRFKDETPNFSLPSDFQLGFSFNAPNMLRKPGSSWENPNYTLTIIARSQKFADFINMKINVENFLTEIEILIQKKNFLKNLVQHVEQNVYDVLSSR